MQLPTTAVGRSIITQLQTALVLLPVGFKISREMAGPIVSSSPISSTSESLQKTGINQSSEYDQQLERQAVRKLDYTILPVIAMCYLLSFVDRSNIGNARVAGLQKDLHMTDKQYEICITALYVPYIASELPSSLFLRKIGPKIFLPTLLVMWGTVATLQGFVTSYAGLVTVRAFLGLVEGPLAPAVIIYLSELYTRKELSLRIALFLSSASLSGAFSGLLAAAIETMDGIGGRPGWSWIFILEGLFSVLVGFVAFFLVPSTPRDSKFLTENQKDIIMKRLEMDRPAIQSVDTFCLKTVLREILRSITSPHVIMIFIMYFMCGTMLYGLALFLPSIVNQLGFSPSHSQLLSIGPYVAGFFLTIFTAFNSDRYELRGITVSLVSLLAVTGFVLYLSAEDKFTLYGALYLMVPGVYASLPVLSAWMANNSEPYYRRATSIALSAIASNSGGILSTWRFPTKEGPKFRKTIIMNLSFSVLIVIGSLINMAYLSWRNQVKKRPGVREKLLKKYVANEKGDDGGLSARMDLGDQHPDFVYTL